MSQNARRNQPTIRARRQALDASERAGLSYEDYCEAIGINPREARDASLLGALAGRLESEQKTVNDMLDLAVHACKNKH